MHMKKILSSVVLIILTSIMAMSQEEIDYSLANVGNQIEGVYIFVQSEPVQHYTHVGTINVNVRNLDRKTFTNAIEKAKKHYPYFNGMIFRYEKLSRVDLVKFDDLDVSRKGIKLNEKVSFTRGKQVCYGDVIAFVDKNNAQVKYIDDYGDEKVYELPFLLLTPIEESVYDVKVKETMDNLKTFNVGDQVILVEGFGIERKSYKGEIVGLSKDGHKANVEYWKNGNKQVKKISILDLSLNTEEYQ